MFYTHNRYGLGYSFEENAGWLYQNSKYSWKKKIENIKSVCMEKWDDRVKVGK